MPYLCRAAPLFPGIVIAFRCALPPCNSNSQLSASTFLNQFLYVLSNASYFAATSVMLVFILMCRKQPVLRTRLLFGTAAAVLIGAHHSGMTVGIGSK